MANMGMIFSTTKRQEINQQNIAELTEISRETNLAGTTKGNVVVCEGGTLYLFGTVSKDLSVQPGGKAMIFGTVMGDVWNRGGNLEIYGTVQGHLVRQAGSTLMGKEARVGKQ
jgi:hypothetical protein